MNQEVKQKWLRALRSDEYKQGRGCLCAEEDHFCCLGVLCDLYVQEHNANWEDGILLDSRYYLPDLVVEWAQLPNGDPTVIAEGITLSRLNDDGRSFHDIAGIIESCL